MLVRRLAAVLGVLTALLAPPQLRADSPVAPADALPAAREQYFHHLWPAASVPAEAAADAIRDLLAADRPWEAAIQAARLEADLGDAPDPAALLAIAAARSGLLDIADAARVRAANADRRLLADAVIEIAQARLANGEAEAAIAALSALPVRLERSSRNRAMLIKARAQLALDRPRDAAQTLQSAEYDVLKLIGAPVDERLAASVLQYDLGVALIRSGAVARGRALLERLGREGSDQNPVEQALRDRANLILASDFLKAGQGATARAIYERVALEGPNSNRALLGMGWAALGPQGDAQRSALNLDNADTRSTPKFVLKAMQRRRLIDCDNYNRRALAPTELCRRPPRFDQAEIPDRPEGLAEEARAVWQELSARDRRDPAVREALGALGHAAARAGLRAEAISDYEAAVSHFEAALATNREAAERTDAALATALAEAPFASGLPPGSQIPVAALIAFELAVGIDAVPSSASHQPLLAEYSETRWLLAAVPEDPVLTALHDAQRLALTDRIRIALDTEQEQLRRVLASARAALATLSDPSFVLEVDARVMRR